MNFKMIKEGTMVSVHYTGRYTDGDVFDTSDGKDPLNFQIGAGQILPKFEQALIGKKVGDFVKVNIEAQDAYGPIREELIIEVSNDKLPGPVEVGQTLQAISDNNTPVQVVVTEVHDNHVIIDGNHPLAGEDLMFEIQIMDVK